MRGSVHNLLFIFDRKQKQFRNNPLLKLTNANRGYNQRPFLDVFRLECLSKKHMVSEFWSEKLKKEIKSSNSSFAVGISDNIGIPIG